MKRIIAWCAALVMTCGMALGVPTAAGAQSLSTQRLPIEQGTGPQAGYGVTGAQYDSVTGSWTVPATSCLPYEDSEASVWVGLGGLNSSSPLEQIGTDTSCNAGIAQYYAWWEMVPASSSPCPAFPSPEPAGSTSPAGCPQLLSVPVHPGDRINAHVVYVVNGLYSLVISDPTENWSQEVIQSGPDDSVPQARDAALWLVEDRVPLTAYTTGHQWAVNFSNCTANQHPISNGPILLVRLITSWPYWARPGGLSSGGTAFSVNRSIFFF